MGQNSSSVFLEDFLQISSLYTVLFLILLVFLFISMKLMKNKFSFTIRILIGMFIGLAAGLIMQAIGGFPDKPFNVRFIKESISWYSLFGGGYISLIRMLVIPLVFISIVKVITDMNNTVKLGKLVRNTLILTMTMVAIASCVGLTFGILFDIGDIGTVNDTVANSRKVEPVITTLKNLIPVNPIRAMSSDNIVAVVIFATFIGISARSSKQLFPKLISPFYELVDSIYKIVMTMASKIIDLMPYAIMPMIAETIASRGVGAIFAVSKFIIILYIAMAFMFLIQLLLLMIFGISPIFYLKKVFHVLMLAFTSRSSVGTLPVTLDTLTNKLGVSSTTANFVASFSTTAGMQGCAGVMPAMLIAFVCNIQDISLDAGMIIMSIIVVTIGSIGIAGVPGTATMAASVALSGTGLINQFYLITPLIAVDPLMDMGRTLLNVSGAMTNAIVVDKTLGTFNIEEYKNEDELRSEHGVAKNI